MFHLTLSVRRLACLLGCASLIAANGVRAEESKATLTGHIDIVSDYIIRGASTTYGPFSPGFNNSGADAPESNRPALQWGADWVHPSGFFLGYFGSQINYSYEQFGRSYSDRSILDFQRNKSIENDFYGGYTGKLGDFGYTVGLTGYYYINGKHANAVESKLGISYGDFNLTAQTLLKDVVWGNRGDTYFALNYVKPLPYQITLTSSLGFYAYEKQGKFLGTVDTLTGTPCAAGESFSVNGCFAGNAPRSGGFRHLIIGFVQPIFDTGLTWGLQGLIGGDNRFGIKQENKLIGSISYLF